MGEEAAQLRWCAPVSYLRTSGYMIAAAARFIVNPAAVHDRRRRGYLIAAAEVHQCPPGQGEQGEKGETLHLISLNVCYVTDYVADHDARFGGAEMENILATLLEQDDRACARRELHEPHSPIGGHEVGHHTVTKYPRRCGERNCSPKGSFFLMMTVKMRVGEISNLHNKI